MSRKIELTRKIEIRGVKTFEKGEISEEDLKLIRSQNKPIYEDFIKMTNVVIEEPKSEKKAKKTEIEQEK